MTKEWLRYRSTILGLYKDQSKTLDEVRRIMKEEYGFEASVRAYRSRFDKWRIHKYNCARRRAVTVTAAGSFHQQEGYLCRGRDVHVPASHAECQFLPIRHYSAPDVLATESEFRPYTPQEPYTTTRPGIKPEPPVDHENSPRIQPVGGEHQPGQAYRSWFESSHSAGIGDATHQAPKAEGGVSASSCSSNNSSSPPSTTNTTTRMFFSNSGGIPQARGAADNNNNSSPSPYNATDQLHWIMHAVQVPLQQDALETLRQYLLCSPVVTRGLSSGESPFSRLAIMVWQQLASDGTLGPEPVWKLAAECLRQFLLLGEDPDVLVGDRPLLIRILEQPVRTRAFDLLWPFVWTLAQQASPANHHHHHGLNALHTLLLSMGASEIGVGGMAVIVPTDIAAARTRLVKLLVTRVAEAGRLADRNAQGYTALQQYVYHTARHDYPEHVLAICAELVRHEASSSSSAVVSPTFVADLRAGKLAAGLHDQASAAGLLPFVWTSACQLSVAGDATAAEEHLNVVLCCIGRRAEAEQLRVMLPRPVVPAPMALPSPVSPLAVSPRVEVKYAW
ncbi:hypothetical protein KVR01_000884 [Diaporthe batatas]|uniref:uncharacterized protein n=1 Tax=Diaporthe batatas TaxID=748121 RepID=UPI001D03BB4A|nr:uncharacterized protein KVR01_000884 [Diaporthe batatas]KAG8170139.1 hypothetical protein KVR01_000884 [Diaporthe batatas]